MIQKLLKLDLEHVLLLEDPAFVAAHVFILCQPDRITVRLDRPGDAPLSRTMAREATAPDAFAVEERLVSAAILALPFEEAWEAALREQEPSPAPPPAIPPPSSLPPFVEKWRFGAGTQGVVTFGPSSPQAGAYLEVGRQWESGPRVSAGPLVQGGLSAQVRDTGEAAMIGVGGRVQVEQSVALSKSWHASFGVAGVGMGVRSSGDAAPGQGSSSATAWSPWAGAHGVVGIEYHLGHTAIHVEGFGGHTLLGVRARADDEVVLNLAGPYSGAGLSVLRLF